MIYKYFCLLYSPFALTRRDDGGDVGLREAVWLDGDLDPALPLLLPRVLHLPVVVCLQRLVVRELHRGDQVLPEQLQTTKYFY